VNSTTFQTQSSLRRWFKAKTLSFTQLFLQVQQLFHLQEFLFLGQASCKVTRVENSYSKYIRSFIAQQIRTMLKDLSYSQFHLYFACLVQSSLCPNNERTSTSIEWCSFLGSLYKRISKDLVPSFLLSFFYI